MTRRRIGRAHRRRGGLPIAVIVALAMSVAATGCKPSAPVDIPAPGGGGSRMEDAPLEGGTTDGGRIDCVGVVHQVRNRGRDFANVQRFGEGSATLRTSARLADLSPSDLRAFCDWEACVRTNGYAHSCRVTDAGWERCRVCDGGDDCDGFPLSGDDCVAHGGDPGRATCHIGLLQECLIQRGLRGFADPRVTVTCQLSDAACNGSLMGDLTTEALAAQHETDQVTMEVIYGEVCRALQLEPGSPYVLEWRDKISNWEGGLPPGDDASCMYATSSLFSDAAAGD